MNKPILTVLLAIAVSSSLAQDLRRDQVDSLARIVQQGHKDQPELYSLLRLADYYIGKPGEIKADLDSGADYIGKARQLNALLQSKEGEGYILLDNSYLCKERKQRDEGKKLAEHATAILENSKNPGLLAKAYFACSDYYDYRDSISRRTRIDLLGKALTAYEQSGNLQQQGYCLEKLTDLYLWDGKAMKALECGRLSLERYRAAHMTNLEGPNVLLSRVYQYLEDYQQAVGYCLEAIANAAAAKDSSMQLCQINFTAAAMYFHLKDYGRSIRYMRDALRVADKHHDTVNVYVVAANLAIMYNNLHRSPEALSFLDSVARSYAVPPHSALSYQVEGAYTTAYAAVKQYKKGERSCADLVKFAHSSKPQKQQRFDLYDVVMKFYLETGEIRRAKDSLPVFLQFAQENNTQANWLEAYNMAFRVDTALGDQRASVRDLLKYNALNDSMFNEKKSRQIQQLQVAYETAEKEKDIALLQKEGESQKHALAQSNEARNFSVIGVVALLLLLGVGVSRYRLKQRSNRLLKQQKLEILEKNSRLEKLLRENEWLLREVHHRVKNNLQIVMSLLISQSEYLEDELAFAAVMESRHRMQAMSMIHQKLYNSNQVSTIYMPEYISDMTQYFQESLDRQKKVRFSLQVEHIRLDVLQAVPVGLILNEVITNAFKYAFPHSAEDQIAIRLTMDRDKLITLSIADNGRGLPPDFDLRQTHSFGLRLIHGMVEDLEGTLDVDRERGTAYRISFQQVVPGAELAAYAG